MKRRAGRACDLARDKIAGGAFVKRACRRPPTGRTAMSAACVLEGQQVTKSVIATTPMLPYRGSISACVCRVIRRRMPAFDVSAARWRTKSLTAAEGSADRRRHFIAREIPSMCAFHRTAGSVRRS
jgi:hypothetical protein